MSKSTVPAFAALSLAAALGTGCDSDATNTADDYRTAAHVDLAAAGAAPWVKAALKDHAPEVAGELGACLDVFKAAQSITLGTSDAGYEVYFVGPIDSRDADGCTDVLDKAAKKSGKRDDDDPEGVMLDGDLFAVHSRTVSPSRARMETLLTADPSPSDTKSMWLVAQPDTVKTGKVPVEFVQVWANTAKGLDVHADVQFKDKAMATELYGQAMMGLTAMRLSGETEELARAVTLASQGDTITADVNIPAATLTKLIKSHNASAKIKAKSGGKDKRNSISISLGTGK